MVYTPNGNICTAPLLTSGVPGVPYMLKNPENVTNTDGISEANTVSGEKKLQNKLQKGASEVKSARKTSS